MRRPSLIMLSSAAILCLALGMARSYGLFLKPMTADLGIGRNAFALAVAIQQIVWGLAQPAAGMISDRFGAARVLSVGGLVYLAGLVVMGNAGSATSLALGNGLLAGLGLSATSFSVVLGAVGRLLPAEKRTLGLAIASTGGSFGQFIVFPVTGALLGALGWSRALAILGCAMAAILPLSWALRGRAEEVSGRAPGSGAMLDVLGLALGHRSYRLLVAGFSVCGFHVAFISSHLPAYLADKGLGALGMGAMGVVGLFNVVGTYFWGVYADRHRKKHLLAGLYAARGAAMVLFLALPISASTVLTFSAVMGLLWLGTVPLTSGLVAQLFGTRYMSTLFGGVFLGHQIGAFLGVWLGGWAFDTFGSYAVTWQLAIVLSFVAAVMHLRLSDQPEAPSASAMAAAAE